MRERVRFDYVCDLLVFVTLELVSEFSDLTGNDPGLWKEVVLKREFSAHSHQVASQVVLAGHNVHPWVLVDFLMRMHLCQEVRRDTQVVPGDVPLLAQFLP